MVASCVRGVAKDSSTCIQQEIPRDCFEEFSTHELPERCYDLPISERGVADLTTLTFSVEKQVGHCSLASSSRFLSGWSGDLDSI